MAQAQLIQQERREEKQAGSKYYRINIGLTTDADLINLSQFRTVNGGVNMTSSLGGVQVTASASNLALSGLTADTQNLMY